ncbi:hypothetical protein RD792_004440 [Penstemon davidsonii]|uniref:Uncharacterized protein n=1 Tax=Penstemon davidsonii TaxID=160366 RepID=A0ABR0DHZ6_9LAMI|nr:hypothetical protein RD792_004440 [Penstemon davidsonii]
MGSSSFKALLIIFVVALVNSVSSQSVVCPFDFLYHLGDGVFDNGNSIVIQPKLPAAHWPYGITYPGKPTGRWCDGLLDIDIGATAMGFPVLTPYLGGNASSNNAIIFAVARSPILGRSFFASRRVRIPPYAMPLNIQLSWFKQHIHSICSTPTDCVDKVGRSLILFGDVEANDITFPLLQGKSIREVRTYVSKVTQAQISAAKEVIKMGATRVILPGNVPIGCYPFILTELGPNKNATLKACCGIGGKYNYNGRRFCGSRGVPVCSDPNQYIYWDGIHLTQAANDRLSQILQVDALESLNCTSSEKIYYPLDNYNYLRQRKSVVISY